MSPKQTWPDVDGCPVTVGDWVEVFCSWTQQPKFEGRAVQVVDILTGSRGAVFRLRDPEVVEEGSGLFLMADGAGYRRVVESTAADMLA